MTEGAANHDLPVNEILAHVRAQYTLSWHGIHGVQHWARVCANGLRLAPTVNADPIVVELFALFHDACRFNDGHDPQHGPRGADLARAVQDDLLSALTTKQFTQLCLACEHHTHLRTHDDVTVQVCFDADRLDLARVGKTPKPKYLSTKAACDPALIAWASQRAVTAYRVDDVLERWQDLS